MVQIQLISNLIGWERKLELTEERRKSHRSEPYVNYLAAPKTSQEESIYQQEGRVPADFVKALSSLL